MTSPAWNAASPAPGIYGGIPNEVYHASPGLSRSRLKVLLTGTPSDFKNANPVEETPSMRLGQALELAILEPDRFDELVRPEPNFGDMRYKENKAAKAKWKADNEADLVGKILVPEDSYAQAVDAAKIVRMKKGPATALREGKTQLSLWWDQDGILCKSRPDMLDLERGFSLDIKTTERELDDAQIVRILHDQHGAMQAAMVGCAVAALTGKAIASYLLVIRPKQPLDMRVVLVGDPTTPGASLEWLEFGEQQLFKALGIYRECEASGAWPGWADRGVTECPMPSWLAKRAETLTQENATTTP